MQLGIDPSHLSVHDGALFAEPALFDVLVELAVGESLPLRLPDRDAAGSLGYPLHDLAGSRGVISPDHVRWTDPGELRSPEAFVASLPVGVTELVTRPALDTAELRALAPDAEDRIADLDALVGGLGETLRERAVTVTSWAALRTVARAS
jgi:hypothetical protein